jgi:hypothetical protein
MQSKSAVPVPSLYEHTSSPHHPYKTSLFSQGRSHKPSKKRQKGPRGTFSKLQVKTSSSQKKNRSLLSSKRDNAFMSAAYTTQRILAGGRGIPTNNRNGMGGGGLLHHPAHPATLPHPRHYLVAATTAPRHHG